MKFLLPLIWVLIAMVCSASAEPEMRTCRIIFPDRPNDAPRAAHLYDGEKSREITLPSMNFSEVIILPAGEITLLLSPGEIKDPANPPAGAPTLRIGKNVNDFYILVSHDPGNAALPLGMKLVVASDGELKAGETVWCNLTDHRISVELGDSKLSVDPQSQTVSKAPLPENGYFKAEFSYQQDAKGDLRKVTEQQWWHDANCRHMGIILNSGGKLPKVYFYRDFR